MLCDSLDRLLPFSYGATHGRFIKTAVEDHLANVAQNTDSLLKSDPRDADLRLRTLALCIILKTPGKTFGPLSTFNFQDDNLIAGKSKRCIVY